MYRKYNSNDELFTNFGFSFIILLLICFKLYTYFINDRVTEIDFYFLVSFSGFLLIYTLYQLILVILNSRTNKIDIELDFIANQIKFKNNRKKFDFNQISLIGYNEKKHDTRIYVKGRLYGFLNRSLRNELDEPINETHIKEIGNHTKVVKHSHLYNYNLIILMLMIVAQLIFLFMKEDLKLFGITVINLYLFIVLTIIYIVLNQLNRYRLSRIINWEFIQEKRDRRRYERIRKRELRAKIKLEKENEKASLKATEIENQKIEE